MKLLFVVQRYGLEVAGGSERCCREFAERLRARGHDVEVLTTTARSYVDWANEYPPGSMLLNDVLVHRLPVAEQRDNERFGSFSARVIGFSHGVVRPQHIERTWMRMQGPWVPQVEPWLRENAPSFDVVIFFTYLYYTAWAGLGATAGLVPTVLHPTAHDEGPLYLGLFDLMFRLPDAFGFLTEEEQALVQRRFGASQPAAVVGVGVDFDPVVGSVDDFRSQYGLGDRPYLVFVGRLDPGKGSDELFDFFRTYKQRNGGKLALVFVGEPVSPVPPHVDVVVTGFVDEPTKQAAMAGAVALVQPSYFESFSMVLTEAWALGRPALVQGRCDVLAGQARRSGGAIPYRGFAEFEAAVDVLTGDPELARRLGAGGRRYVELRYDWDDLLSRYELLLEEVTGGSR